MEGFDIYWDGDDSENNHWDYCQTREEADDRARVLNMLYGEDGRHYYVVER